MKQKTKLLLAFLILIFMPVVLIVLAFLGVQHFHRLQLKDNYGIESSDFSYLTNSVQLLSRYTTQEYYELKSLVTENGAEEVLDKDKLYELDSRLLEKDSLLVIVKDGELYFPEIDKEESGHDLGKLGVNILDLKGFGDNGSEDEMGAYVAKSGKAIIKKIDFVFPDNAKGKAFIITSASAVIPETRRLFIDMMVSCVLILVFTASMLAFWIYNGTISPIAKLSAATKKIMDDDFDFTIIPESNDEIGELCKNFEEMRSKLEQYAKERLEAENTNRELISNISHDLKTPLTTVRGYCEGIMDGVADTPEKIEHYVMTIYNKTNEMTNLVNELALYSKLDTNRIPYNFQKINVASYFDDCVTDLYMELENENITVSYEDYAADDIVIIADPEQLKRVINNIVSNTVKYLDKPKGNINIRIRDVGDFIQVEIEDNGSGIAAKDLPYIFDRFYRSDASRNSSKGGSGIGLSIVKKIIEDHGGKIWATSREGNGTVMYFVLRKYQENREE